jgi:hypothetical protein
MEENYMWSKKTIKNKISAIRLIILAIILLPWLDGDATFLIFALMIAVPLFFDKRNWIIG